MARLDPQLEFLRLERQAIAERRAHGEHHELTGEGVADAELELRILLRYDGREETLAALREAGFAPTTVTRRVAAGFLRYDRLEAVERVPGVAYVEQSRPLRPELHVSIAEVRADQVHGSEPPLRGANVVVGIIDSGIDFSHPCFLDDAGRTRILAIWDQHLRPQGGERSPDSFPFGVEYTRDDIDAALAGTGAVRHRDRDPEGHGTHVACIAAGRRSLHAAAGGQQVLVGVAPEAELVVVSTRPDGVSLGDSGNTLDAVRYILKKAAELQPPRPVVINFSDGDNLGPHDGTSLLELGIDDLLDGPGRALVKSAGNTGNRQIYARGTLTAGVPLELELTVPSGDVEVDTIDLWYAGADRFDVRVRTPAEALSPVVRPDDRAVAHSFPGGNEVFVQSTTRDPRNGDNRIRVELRRGTRATVQDGKWKLVLTATTLAAGGRFDAWIERGGSVPAFTGPEQTPDGAITVPGTARNVITVGAYVTDFVVGRGELARFSAFGPTRDGRPKPDLAAPGQMVTSAAVGGAFRKHLGTSMAAPHVTGAVALMLQKNPALTHAQILALLTETARPQSPPAPGWGAGKLDVRRCCDGA